VEKTTAYPDGGRRRVNSAPKPEQGQIAKPGKIKHQEEPVEASKRSERRLTLHGAERFAQLRAQATRNKELRLIRTPEMVLETKGGDTLFSHRPRPRNVITNTQLEEWAQGTNFMGGTRTQLYQRNKYGKASRHSITTKNFPKEPPTNGSDTLPA